MAKVLVVDDDRDLRGVIKFVLVSAGYEVAESGDALDALEKVQQDHPDLILLGLTISTSEAAEAVKRLREDPATTGIPLITLASEGREGTGVPQTGGQDILARPFTSQQLESKVQLAIVRSQTGKQSVAPAAMASSGIQPESGATPKEIAEAPAVVLSDDGPSVDQTPIVDAHRAATAGAGHQVDIRRFLPGGREAVIAMLLLLGAIAFLGPLAYPIRRGVFGNLDIGDLVDRLPFIDVGEPDNEGPRWSPWINCLSDSLETIHTVDAPETVGSPADGSGADDRHAVGESPSQPGRQERREDDPQSSIPDC